MFPRYLSLRFAALALSGAWALGAARPGDGWVAPVSALELTGFQWRGLPLAPSQSRTIDMRFERYLLLPAEGVREANEYVLRLQAIRELLSPAKLSDGENLRFEVLADAHRRLYALAASPLDGAASATLAAQIKQAWAQRGEIQNDRLRISQETARIARNPHRDSENDARIERRENQRSEEARLLESIHGGGGGAAAANGPVAVGLGAREIRTKGELAHIQFQGMILTFMVERRYEHALMGCCFYRVLFKSSAQRLDAGLDYLARNLPLRGTAPSVDTLEQLCRDSMAAAESGAAAAVLAGKERRYVAALNQLADAFALGEHLPAIQLVADALRGDLYRVRETSAGLEAAWTARDLDQAEKLSLALGELAADFSGDVAASRIATARQEARNALAASRIAAKAGQAEEAARHLARSKAIWPLNPELSAPDLSKHL